MVQVDPLIIKAVAWLLGVLFFLLFSTVGYFVKRTFDKQDKRDEKQDETNQKFQSSIENLNTTMAKVVEAFKWFQEGCEQRHASMKIVKSKSKAI